MLMIFLISASKLFAQACPENIGFENGNFQNWKMYTGVTSIINSKNQVTLSEIPVASVGRHTILNNKILLDPYGNFPVIPKNGGNYSVKLGNSGTGNQAEGISYLINVPANRPEFTLTYQYAIVLEDPNHQPAEQPRFIARVKDVEKNQYIPCASFEYIATSTLPGFKKSTVSSTVIYKDWSPVTINLSGYQGKQLLIEFISADCTLGGHFGYAYVDVNNLCGDLIAGNTYCKSSDQLRVSGPSGFKDYNWFNEDRSVQYGSGQALTIKPTPAEGTKIFLDLIPYDGYGCPSTVSAVVHSVDYELQLLSKTTICQDAEIDLTSTDYVLNKSPDFTYLVYADKDLTQLITGPTKVHENATYYVLATNYKGCESVASIDISVFDIANIIVKNPEPVCYTETVDLTKDEIYEGNLTDVSRSYYTDANASKVLANPFKINTSGRYFVKLVNSFNCSKILPVDVVINPKPLLKITNPSAVCFPGKIDLSSGNNFLGSDQDLILSYYSDVNLTKAVTDPKNINQSGTYYIKAINNKGCIVSDKIDVVVNELPALVMTNPLPVCFPEKVDITNPLLYNGTTAGVTYSYFTDQSLTTKVTNPKQVSESGNYYVKITNSSGCFVSGKVTLVVNPLPIIVLNKPKPIFDYDFIDLTSAEIVTGSKGYVKASYFEDALLRKPIADPTKVNKAGVYYIALENDKGCSIAGAIELNILPSPKIMVPTAFTPQKNNNNRLYPFFVSIQKLLSFKVYNKWGILVFQTDDMATSGWDGQLKTKLQPLETFSWFADGIDLLGGKYQSQGKTILIL